MANDAAYLANVLGQCRQASLECDVDGARDEVVRLAVLAYRERESSSEDWQEQTEALLGIAEAVDAYLRAKEAAEKG